jgi:DNA repair protein RadC
LKHIKDIPDFDRPREKLAAKGPEALSDSELIAILLGKAYGDVHYYILGS